MNIYFKNNISQTNQTEERFTHYEIQLRNMNQTIDILNRKCGKVKAIY